jgi:hypothetical protein
MSKIFHRTKVILVISSFDLVILWIKFGFLADEAEEQKVSDVEDSEEDELTLMGTIKAGKDGKPIKSVKIKKIKSKMTTEERDKMQHTEEVSVQLSQLMKL